MELPKPPPDIELRNIIDKLAQFVARNGPEFEQMTKNKQKGNPKFGFLFGGEYFNYYQYKVTTEQAILKQKETREVVASPSTPSLSSLLLSAVQGANPQNPATLSLANTQGWALALGAAVIPPGLTVEAIAQQQAVLHEQTTQSEQNLNAQHIVLLQQQEVEIEEQIRKVEEETLGKSAEELGVSLADLDAVLQPITDTCTKDSISNGKAWILTRATSPTLNDLLASYLLFKVLEPDRKFNHKLHIIYLVNDILHHCVRKHTEDFKVALEKVVVPMFCNAALNVTEDQQAKLNKLLNIWESKNHYFNDDIVRRLRDPVNSWAAYRAEKMARNAEIVASVNAATKTAFAGFQSQHLAFVSHTMQQIQTLEQQKQTLEAQQQAQAVAAAAQAAQAAHQQQLEAHKQHGAVDMERLVAVLGGGGGGGSTAGAVSVPGDDYQATMLQIQQNAISQMAAAAQAAQEEGGAPPVPSGSGGGQAPPPPPPPPPGTVFDLGINITQPPPGYLFPPRGGDGCDDLVPASIELPDLTRPPPGFPLSVAQAVPEVLPEDLLPSLPYYDLPAGLMVPLIKLEDSNYKPLDPENIRLPPPAPPSERLLAAVKAFYSPPGHDQPRDRQVQIGRDGWEKLGLYEYFKAKTAAKKKKEMEILEGLREKSRSPTPVRSFHGNSKSPPARRRYSSRSRSRSRERTGSKNSRMRRRERSRSPGHGAAAQPERDNRSPSPPSFGGRQSGGRRERSRSPQNGQEREKRSPTPPSFAGMAYSREPGEERLAESNKGHQMLRKMGWAGAGLGAKEQGIEAPISGGDVRDRTDQYKGVGINLNDPYENFRKSKGQAFITRMKARAEERS